MKKRFLILEDGTIFQGWGFGAERCAFGELVFNTSVVGYVETLTDPAYCGQIVMQTFPTVGNYGIMEEDFQGKPALQGYVVKEYCDSPSNFRCQYDLDTFLKDHDIPGLYGVDTRELTNRIREYGVVNAVITDFMVDPSEISSYEIRNAVETVTCKEAYSVAADDVEKYHVVVLDFGVKKAILQALASRGCRVTVVPGGTSAKAILALNPDGVLLSSGPGDPTENADYIETVRQLFGKLPVFGVGLGHQILALAAGGKTAKMKFGHRGGNQPCRYADGTRTYITSQNHGYVVLANSVPGAVETFTNVNDGTCEGLNYPDARAFSVQFDPESCGGITDTVFLYDRFIAMMEGK